MRPLSNRIIVSIFPDVTETAGGIVANEAVESHTDRPAWARVHETGPLVKDIESGDVIMFSRFAGVNLDRTGTKRIMSRDEVMMVAELSDVLRVKLFAEDGGVYLGDIHLVPGAEVKLEDGGASVVGILSEAPPVEVLAELPKYDSVTIAFENDGVESEIKTASRTLFNGQQFIARGHKRSDGAFHKIHA